MWGILGRRGQMNGLAELGSMSGISDGQAIEVSKANVKISGSKEQQKRNGNSDLLIAEHRADNTEDNI